MADCTVSVAIEQRSALAAALDTRSALAAAVEQRGTIAAALTERSEVAVAVDQRSAVAAAVSEREAVAAAVSERETLAVEVDLGGLTGFDRAKLDSIEWGATNRPPDLVKLAYATEKSTTTNNSVDWPGTTSFQEVIQFLVPQPAWRQNGYVEWDVTGSFLNSAGAGTETVTFELQRSNPWPTDVGEPAGTFGLPQSWTTFGTFTSLALNTGAGIGVFTFTLRIRANPQTSTVFRQSWSGEMVWSDLAGGEPGFRKFVSRTAIDVTEDQLFRLRFKTDFTPSTDPAFNVKSASAILVCPRDGSDI